MLGQRIDQDITASLYKVLVLILEKTHKNVCFSIYLPVFNQSLSHFFCNQRKTAFILQRPNHIIVMNNKYKAKVNPWQQFSPWEESFRDLYITLQLAKRKQAEQRHSTISPQRYSLNLNQNQTSRRSLNRSILNMSKINLDSGHQRIPQVLVPQPRPYLGPRITFYAKMNPRVNQSKTFLQNQQLLHQTQLLKKQKTTRLVKDQSIRYLQMEENLTSPGKQVQEQHYSLQKPSNTHLLRRVEQKKNQQQHAYLRRLKLLYNSRKH